MKLFKSIDERFADIGFIKMKENKYGAVYERKNEEFGYIQVLSLLHKHSGKHLIQSYQKDLNTDNYNNSIGLTVHESILAIKKMKKMGFL